jgi:hypothetical protein
MKLRLAILGLANRQARVVIVVRRAAGSMATGAWANTL